MYIIIGVIYIIGILVMTLSTIMGEIKVKAKCIEIKESNKMQSPIFEIVYDNKLVKICNEVYTKSLKIKKDDICDIYLNKNDLNDFSYDEDSTYKYTKIFGVLILIFATIFLISTLNLSGFFYKTLVSGIFIIVGLLLIVCNFSKMILLYRKCTVKIQGKVLYFIRNTEESYSRTKNYTRILHKYSPVYGFVYKNTEYKISNDKFVFNGHKLVKQGNVYKIRINPDIPNIFIDKFYITSQGIIIVYGIVIML